MNKKDIGTMDKVLIFLAVVIVIFIGVMIWLYKTTGGIPDTLCACVFTLAGGECGVMGMIQNGKNKYRDRQFELEDRKYESRKEEE